MRHVPAREGIGHDRQADGPAGRRRSDVRVRRRSRRLLADGGAEQDDSQPGSGHLRRHREPAGGLETDPDHVRRPGRRIHLQSRDLFRPHRRRLGRARHLHLPQHRARLGDDRQADGPAGHRRSDVRLCRRSRRLLADGGAEQDDSQPGSGDLRRHRGPAGGLETEPDHVRRPGRRIQLQSRDLFRQHRPRRGRARRLHLPQHRAGIGDDRQADGPAGHRRSDVRLRGRPRRLLADGGAEQNDSQPGAGHLRRRRDPAGGLEAEPDHVRRPGRRLQLQSRDVFRQHRPRRGRAGHLHLPQHRAGIGDDRQADGPAGRPRVRRSRSQAVSAPSR